MERTDLTSLSPEELIDLFAKVASARWSTGLGLLTPVDAQAAETDFQNVRTEILRRLNSST